MTKLINWPRLVLVVLIGLGLACVLAAQAFSSFATRNNPEAALSVFPLNGLARADVAFALMTGSGELDDGMPVPTSEAVDQAKAALKSDPLSTKALVVMALSRDSLADRRNVIGLANQLNRRDLSLQGMVLQEALTDEDYEDTIATLDRILRVHPRYSSEFFPILLQALSNEQTIGTFSELLDGSSPWHSSFLNYASRQNTALLNLATLRAQMDFSRREFADLREGFDRRVIARLASAGEVQAATELYRAVISSAESNGSSSGIDWRSQYPPLDWQFIDEAGFRAQTTPDGKAVEVTIRPGNGGIFAQRLIRIPQEPFTVRLDYSVEPVDRARDMRLLLSCANERTAFFEETFDEGVDSFIVREVPQECDDIRLSLAARAWSGRSKLDIELRSISISENGGGS